MSNADSTPFAQLLAEGSLNFMAKNATKPGIVTTPSGLQYEVISRSAHFTAQSSMATSRVTVPPNTPLIFEIELLEIGGTN